ncbi:MAG: TetR/AcrR family transcriptional regulator [Spirochaetes bacterium]|nr:TetR/AcrR family transcriptional regulator [Spirochaetota bacterium]
MTVRDKKDSRRNEIIDAALQVFSRKDYQDATISEITKLAGISEATLYEYFEGKEDLLFAIPGKITDESIEFVQQILPFIRGVEGKIRALVQKYLTVCQENPEYTSLVMLQLKTNIKFRSTEAFEIIRKGARILLNCIKEGIRDGTLRSDTDPYLTRAMILGTIEHICTRWRLMGGPADVSSYTDRIVDSVLHGTMALRDDRDISMHIRFGDEKEITLRRDDGNTAGNDSGDHKP